MPSTIAVACRRAKRCRRTGLTSLLRRRGQGSPVAAIEELTEAVVERLAADNVVVEETVPRHLRWRPHPAFHGYVFFQRWHGVRPGEASGIAWDDVDLRHGVAHIRRSYHYREMGKQKTRAARRTIELHPEMIRILRALRPLRPEPGQPVFPNLDGRRITPRVFWETWKRCLQDCRIAHRGLYSLKDTFVTHTLARADEEPGRRDELISFCVRQTGVREDTLREHYERWWPRDRERVERTYALLDSSIRKIG